MRRHDTPSAGAASVLGVMTASHLAHHGWVEDVLRVSGCWRELADMADLLADRRWPEQHCL
jgi:hypothetical protein